jgi:hypothetical protein
MRVRSLKMRPQPHRECPTILAQPGKAGNRPGWAVFRGGFLNRHAVIVLQAQEKESSFG